VRAVCVEDGLFPLLRLLLTLTVSDMRDAIENNECSMQDHEDL
jgi:hypothetical protein